MMSLTHGQITLIAECAAESKVNTAFCVASATGSYKNSKKSTRISEQSDRGLERNLRH